MKVMKRSILTVLLMSLFMVLAVMVAVNEPAFAETTPTPLTFTAQENNSWVTLTYNSGSNVQYRLNAGEWQNYSEGTKIELDIGKTVSFKGTNVTTDEYEANHFLMGGKIAASGDVTSLTNGVGGEVALTEGCYSYMFQKCTALTTAPNLPSTTLATKCYEEMFCLCTALETAPALPATTLAESCYSHMFNECTALKTACKLPASTLAESCYEGMFQECKALTTAPELPATTLAESCYSYMFNECTALTTAPELPATTLAAECYKSMFVECTTLQAPAMMDRVTALANSCCAAMYFGCTSLNIYTTAQEGYTNEWKATKAEDVPGWAYDMFAYANPDTGTSTQKLVVTARETYYIKGAAVTFTAQADNSSVTFNYSNGSNVQYNINKGEWKDYTEGNVISLGNGDAVSFKGTNVKTNASEHFSMSGKIAASGDVTSLTNGLGGDVKLTEFCYSSMFSGCTALTTAPTLPSTTLATGCYQNMFSGCTSLEAPAMMDHVTDLADSCCSSMYSGCTSLNIYTIPQEGCTRKWKATSVTSASEVSGWATDMFKDCGGDVPSTGVTAGTTYYIHDAADGGLLTFTALKAESEVTFKYLEGTDVQYRVDDGEWKECKSALNADGDTITLKKVGAKVSFKGTGCKTGWDEEYVNCYGFSITEGSVAASGDVTSLTNGIGGDAELTASCYSSMFYGCTSLAIAPELPTTVLTEGCYANMFDGCILLETAPELPAKTLAESCYSCMFHGCTSLAVAPELPATKLAKYCYLDMFNGCVALEEPAMMDEVTTLAESCCGCADPGGMYMGCTKLLIYTSPKKGYAKEWKATNATNATNASEVSGWATNMFKECGGDASEASFEVSAGTTYYIKGEAAHTHSWTYALSTTTSDKDTVTAACSGTGTCTLTDTKLTIQAPDSLEYDGKAHEATFGTATSFCGGNLPEISYQYKAEKTGDYTSTNNTENAGYYKASLAVGEGEDAETASVEYTISRAKVDVPTAEKELVYNGQEQTGVKLPSDAKYSLSGNTGTDAKSDYKATATLNDKNNYEWDLTTPTTDNQEITWSIAKATITPSVTLTGWISGNTANTPSVSGNKGDGKVTYGYKVKGADDNTYSEDVPTTAGEYTVKATVAETSNYKSGSATADFTIEAAVAKVTTSDGKTTCYKELSDAIKAWVDNSTLTLLADAKTNLSVPTDKNCTLDLNGYVLQGTGSGSVITTSGNLTIKDSRKENKTKHYFTEATDGTMLWTWNGDDNTTDYYVEGGVITGGKPSGTSGDGAGIFCHGGSLTIDGVNIVGNQGTYGGGGVTVHSATVTIKGCSIKGNVASGNAGGVAVKGSATATIIGGEISGNVCGSDFNGGGVYYCESSTLTLGGAVKITDNKKGSGTSAVANNLYLTSGKTVTVYTTTPLVSDASIGVTTADTPGTVNITGNNSDNYSTYFTSDNTNYSTTNSGSGSNQVVQLVAHTHSWTYAEGGTDNKDTLKAYCTAEGCDGTATSEGTAEKLIIKAPASGELTYDGNAKAASLVGTDGNSKTSLGGVSDLTINYQKKSGDNTYETATTTAPTAAGTYKASITVDTGKTAFVEYTIAKKELTVTGTGIKASKEYDGKADAEVTVEGTLSGKVKADDVSLDTVTANYDDKNAGADKKVTVKYTLKGDASCNYTAKDSELTASITKKQLTVSGTTVAASKIYDGTADAEITSKGTLGGIVDSENVELDSVSAAYDNANCGENKSVTVTYTIKGDDSGNYQAPANNTSLTAAITKAEVTLSNVSATGITYGQALSSSTISGTAKFKDDNITGNWSWEDGTVTPAVSDSNKTEYTAVFTPDATEHPNLKETEAKVKLTVNKAKVDVPEGSNYAYDGTEKTGVPESTLYNLTNGKKTKAGQYTATATLNDTNNYEWKTTTPTTDDQSVNWTIYPKQLTISSTEGTAVENKTYDGNVTATANIGTVEGKVSKDNIYVKIDSAGFADQNAGTNKEVTVTYKVTGDDAGNYAAPETEKITGTIKTRTVDLYSETKSKAYDGTALTAPTVYGSSERGDVDAVFASEVNDLTATGSVTNVSEGSVQNTISYTFKNDFSADNYNITKTEGTLSITRATPLSTDFTFTAPANLTVDGTAKEATVAAKDGITGMGNITAVEYSSDSGSTWTMDAPKVACTYTVRIAVAEGDNYNAKTDITGSSWTFTLKEAPAPTPTPVTKYTVTFDSQGHGVVPQSQIIEEGGKVSDPGSLKEEGYIFEGWFTDKDCTEEWDFDKDTVTKSMTLYAKWTEEPQPADPKEAFMATGSVKGQSNTIKWNAVDDADGYEVYYAKCGTKFKNMKTTTDLKFTKKGLNKKYIYKYYVRAYVKTDGEKEYIATSPVIHIAGVSTKYSNATKVTSDPDGIFFEVGDTDKITAKITKTSNKKKAVLWKNHVKSKIRYTSSDESVVTVDGKGNVTGIGKGTAYVYAYAASGAFARVTVTVD